MKLKLFAVEREVKMRAFVAAASAEEALVVAANMDDDDMAGEWGGACSEPVREDFARLALREELDGLRDNKLDAQAWMGSAKTADESGPELREFLAALRDGDGTVDDEEE